MSASLPTSGQVHEAMRRRDHATAEALLGRILERDPAQAQSWRDLGLIRLAAGRKALAVEAFERAVAAGLAPSAIAFDHARTLSDLGRHEEAEALVAAAQARRPRDYPLANLRGVLLKRMGRLREAVGQFEAARKLDPKNHSPLVNLGNVWTALGEGAKAKECFARAVRLAPKDSECWRLLGQAHRNAGEVVEARRCFERALLLNPRGQEALTDLVGLLVEDGQAARAEALLAAAMQADPKAIGPRLIQAQLCRLQGRPDEAEALLRQVLEIDSLNLTALLTLARMNEERDRAAAIDFLRRAVAAHPDSVEAAGLLCDSLNRHRVGDEAAHIQDSYENAVRMLSRFGEAARPQARALRGVFARCVDFERLEGAGTLDQLLPIWTRAGQLSALHLELGRVQGLEGRRRMVEWHRQIAGLVSQRARRGRKMPAPALIGGAKIRVGFMSSDLRHHPVSYFALPLFEAYDRERFEVFCYSFYEREADRVQQHIATKVDGFRWWQRKSDEEIAAGIAADGLDMLFELGGSTAMNRLEVMAFRPARLGASWLGYPHSAGYEEIDYILVDPYLKPDDPSLLVERPFEMPESWVCLSRLGFEPYPITPEIPELRHGHLTFGTMNNPYKFTPACFDAWARVLRALPDARFLFVRPESAVPAFRANVEREFARRDVAPERVKYVAVRGKHMPHYNDIDIALDSFPHVGGTTTCETLWMGVPVVTMVGPAFFERLSHSNLNNAGIADLSAANEDEYVAKALALAEDRARRQHLRTGLRAQIMQHPLGQPARFVRAFYEQVAKVATR